YLLVSLVSFVSPCFVSLTMSTEKKQIVWSESDLQLFKESGIDVKSFPEPVLFMLETVLSESKKREKEVSELVLENKQLRHELSILHTSIEAKEKEQKEKVKKEKEEKKEKEKHRESIYVPLP